MAKPRASPLYNVSDGIVVDATIAPFRARERELARQPVESFLRLAAVLGFRRALSLLRACPRTSGKGMPTLPFLLFYLMTHHIRPGMRAGELLSQNHRCRSI